MLALAGIAAIFCRCRDDPAGACSPANCSAAAVARRRLGLLRAAAHNASAQDTVGGDRRAQIRSALRIFGLCCGLCGAGIFSRVLGLQRDLVGRDRGPHQLLQPLLRVSAGSRAAFCRWRLDCVREQARRLIRRKRLGQLGRKREPLEKIAPVLVWVRRLVRQRRSPLPASRNTASPGTIGSY